MMSGEDEDDATTPTAVAGDANMGAIEPAITEPAAPRVRTMEAITERLLRMIPPRRMPRLGA
jgi:hypothetical protein